MTDTPDTEQCGNCRYWQDATCDDDTTLGDRIGDCRRYPSQWGRPLETLAGDWCGEWKAKDG